MTEPVTTEADVTESATSAESGTAAPEITGDEAAGLTFAVTPENEDILEALRDVVDPELGINVVDLGLIYGIDMGEDRLATIDMTLTSAACPLTDVIEDQTRAALGGFLRSTWVCIPPWGPYKIAEAGREQLRAL